MQFCGSVIATAIRSVVRECQAVDLSELQHLLLNFSKNTCFLRVYVRFSSGKDEYIKLNKQLVQRFVRLVDFFSRMKLARAAISDENGVLILNTRLRKK